MQNKFVAILACFFCGFNTFANDNYFFPGGIKCGPKLENTILNGLGFYNNNVMADGVKRTETTQSDLKKEFIPEMEQFTNSFVSESDTVGKALIEIEKEKALRRDNLEDLASRLKTLRSLGVSENEKTTLKEMQDLDNSITVVNNELAQLEKEQWAIVKKNPQFTLIQEDSSRSLVPRKNIDFNKFSKFVKENSDRIEIARQMGLLKTKILTKQLVPYGFLKDPSNFEVIKYNNLNLQYQKSTSYSSSIDFPKVNRVIVLKDKEGQITSISLLSSRSKWSDTTMAKITCDESQRPNLSSAIKSWPDMPEKLKAALIAMDPSSSKARASSGKRVAPISGSAAVKK